MNFKKSAILMFVLSFCTTTFAQESLKDKARNIVEQGENIYFWNMIKHRCKNRVEKLDKWAIEQPIYIQIPVAIGVGAVATTVAVSTLYTIAYTAAFIPSLVLSPLSTFGHVLSGSPQHVLGAFGTLTAALCAGLCTQI